MKRLSYHITALITAMMSIACSSIVEESIKPESDIVTASISTETRTAIGSETGRGHKVVWSEGDRILISTGALKSQQATYRAVSHGSSTASFALEKGSNTIDFKGGAIAGYPVDGMYIGKPGADLYFTIPVEQNYVEGSFDEGAMPMISDVAYEPVLNFHNAASVLRINLSTGLSDISVEDITITSSEFISGDCIYSPQSGVISFDVSTASSNSVSLKCGDGVKISSAPTPFYIVVPHQTYTEMSICVTTSDKLQQTFRMKSGKEINVKRSTITTIPLTIGAPAEVEEPEINVKIESVTFDNFSINVNMKNVTSYYCGLMTERSFRQEMNSGTLIEVIPYTTIYTAPLSYAGTVTNFQDAMKDILIEPGQDYVLWFAAHKADGSYTADDIVYAEVTTKSFTSGGTIAVSFTNPVIDMTSISVTLNAPGAKYIYSRLMPEEELAAYPTDAQKIELLIKPGNASTVFGPQDIFIRKSLRPGARMILLAVAIDKNGRYGPLLEEMLQTEPIPYNNLKVEIDKDIEALRSSSTINWSVTGGEAVKYRVFFNNTGSHYWNNVFNSTVEMVQEKMYLDSSLFYIKHLDVPYYKPALTAGTEYIMIVTAVDAEGNISVADSWTFIF